MAFVTDNLSAAIKGLGPMMGGYQDGPLTQLFTHDLALIAYQSSGMMKKVVALPATARTQKWRDWQADDEQIELIEAEEKRLNLRAKYGQAELLRGVGGGALILVAEGEHDQPLTPEQIRAGGLVAVNVVSRWQIDPVDFDKEITSPTYGEPAMFEVATESAGRQRIHPSRVIAFRGPPLPAGRFVNDVEQYWGDSRLLRVFDAVMRSDNAQEWFAALVKKAKLLRFGIPGLSGMDGDVATQSLQQRLALIAHCENILSATVYDAGDGKDGSNPGETITDFTISFTGIPEMADMFDLRVSAVADIPFTILMGRSPAGMNSTGEHDMESWRDKVSDGQENELRPCMEALDPFLLRSAGIANSDEVWWQFAPLDTPDQKESAETFKLTSEAIKNIRDANVVPDVALNEAAQNTLLERGWMPGLEGALDKLTDDERFGIVTNMPEAGEGDEDPSAIAVTGDPLTDAKPIPLYVKRELLNAGDLIKWANDNGLPTTLTPEDMHVTVLYSREPVDPIKMGTAWGEDEKGNLTIKRGGPRALERFGEGALVLQFASWDLLHRHNDMIREGASHDWPEYLPHVTITYNVPEGFDIDAVRPYNGELRFGPEIFEPLDLEWKGKVTER